MQVRVLLFASYADIAGAPEVQLDLEAGATVSACMREMSRRYPAFAATLPSARAAVNLDIVDGSRRIEENDEVAFMPPMSGG